MIRTHKTMRLVTFVLAALLVLAGCAASEPEARYAHFTAEPSAESLMADIAELSSEAYNGRLTGTAGNEAAMAYIASAMEASGMDAPYGPGDYIQEYTQLVMAPFDGMTLEVLTPDGETVSRLIPYEHFREALHYTHADGDTDITAPAVLITDASQLANGEAEGKIAVIHRSLVESGELEPLFRAAYFGKAVGVLFNRTGKYNEIYYVKSASITDALYEAGLEDEGGIPSLYIDAVGMGVMEEAIAAGNEVHLAIHFAMESVETGNVVGVIPGDPGKETLYIGAHLDHVGAYSLEYCPGALDNASGVSAVLEIARALGDETQVPEKNIVLIAFNGEETGLRGSKYFTTDPLYDLTSSVMINLDMVGSKRDVPLSIEKSQYYNASDPSELIGDLAELSNEVGIQSSTGGTGSSDHIYFASAGSQAAMLINLDMTDIHSPLDTAERDVDPGYLAQIVDVLLRYIDENAY